MGATDPIGTGRLLLFGASGAIGGAIDRHYTRQGWQVVRVTRGNTGRTPSDGFLAWDPLDDDSSGEAAIVTAGPFDAVCWAQGANCNDSIFDFDAGTHQAIYRANVLSILMSLSRLLAGDALVSPARLCVIGSIWQNQARQNKLSYCISKAAIQGLVLSLANDLGSNGHLVNAVLPGVLDTPMTRANLSSDQIRKVQSSTRFGRLATLEDVAAAVYGLTSFRNNGVTGQFLNVDLGYTHVRVI
ncbi:MAG: SDR family oxidoreductase [Rhodanobacteraceae bacterium]|nr:SDR family oxidoreductase [Rhodanobacteraceae bacterium]